MAAGSGSGRGEVTRLTSARGQRQRRVDRQCAGRARARPPSRRHLGRAGEVVGEAQP